MSFLYESFATGDDAFNGIYGVYWSGQTFFCYYSHTIVSVKLKLYWQWFAPTGNITVSIRASNGGQPTGADLCSGTLNSATLTGTPTWYEITLGAGAALTSENEYAIVVHAPNQYPCWRRAATGGYGSGFGLFSIDSGVNWGESSDDYLFEEYGTEDPAGADVDVNVPLCTISDIVPLTPIVATPSASDFQSIPRFYVTQLIDDDDLNTYLRTNMTYLKTLEESSLFPKYSDYISWSSPEGFDLGTYPNQSVFGGVCLDMTGSGTHAVEPGTEYPAQVNSVDNVCTVLQGRQTTVDFVLLYTYFESTQYYGHFHLKLGTTEGITINPWEITNLGGRGLTNTTSGACFVPIRFIILPGTWPDGWVKYFINNKLVYTQQSSTVTTGTACKLLISAVGGPYIDLSIPRTDWHNSQFKISRVCITQEY